MAEQLGRLSVELGELATESLDHFAELINQRVSPSQPVTAEQIFVAYMYLVSDEVNSFGGRFPTDEHARIAQLLIDSPVIVGHRKDRLPIGRTFNAELVERDGRRWVKSSFYWPKSSAGANDLKDSIEAGVCKECSIAFTYNLPECSICGGDIRVCEHEPLREYATPSGTLQCHYNYRQIERVLESSLVYRGAVPNTLVTRESVGAPRQPNDYGTLARINRLDELVSTDLYLVVPRYDSIPVLADCQDGRLNVRRQDGSPIGGAIIEQLTATPVNDFPSLPALLIGYRGKERCTRPELERHLQNQAGPVTRLTLALYPDSRFGVRVQKHRKSLRGIRNLPYRITRGDNIPSAAAQLATCSGVEIWPFGSIPLIDSGYLYLSGRNTEDHLQSYSLTSGRGNLDSQLTIHCGKTVKRYALIGFDCNLLARGARFLADFSDETSAPESSARLLSGPIERIANRGRSTILSFGGPIAGHYLIRPITIGGRARFLFSRLAETSARRGGIHA